MGEGTREFFASSLLQRFLSLLWPSHCGMCRLCGHFFVEVELRPLLCSICPVSQRSYGLRIGIIGVY